MIAAYYNEIEPFAVAALHELMSLDLIAPGHIDSRSIKEVEPDDLEGFTQCHFFAGAGIWSVAARLAGWPDARPLWTGSCPCQPFSVAGKGGGTDDPRHLWPDLFRLWKARRPAVLVGEQVAGAAGYAWFDGIAADMAGEGVAARAVDIPACAVDAPHIRQRLYWCALADSDGERSLSATRSGVHSQAQSERPRDGEPERLHGIGVTQGDAKRAGLEGFGGHEHEGPGRSEPDRSIAAADGGELANSKIKSGRAGLRQDGTQQDGPFVANGFGRNGSFWSGAEWIICHDGKARRTEPSIRLLVDGMAGRSDLWRLAGNSISPVLAAEVIGALPC